MFKFSSKVPQPSAANPTDETKQDEDPRIAAMKRRMLEKSRVSAFGGKKNGV